MTKLLKKVAISVCALLAFCCLAVGCDIIDYDPMSANSVNYTVQVSAEDNTSVKGIDVVFNKDGETVATYILDETGVVVADLPAAEYTVTLGNLPEGYALSAEKVTPADRSLIALVVVKANYSVIVHADDDIAFDGMKVSFYTEEALNEFELDSTGKVEVNLPVDAYQVTVGNIPTGYKCDAVVNTGDSFETIVFYVEKTFATPVSVETVNFADGVNDLYEVEMANYVQNASTDTVLVEVKDSKDAAYISVRPPFVGKYRVSVEGLVITEYPYSTYINGISPVGSGVGTYEYEVSSTYFYKEVENVDTGEVTTVPAEEYSDVFQFTLAEGTKGGAFVVTIERFGEETPDTTVRVTVDGTDLPYADESNYDEYFVAAPVPYGTEVVYNIYDGYFHIGDEYGDILYVATSAANRYYNDTFASAYGAGQPLTYSVIDDEGNVTIYDFSKYILEDLVIRDTSLGLYPCTMQLYKFLHGFVELTGYYLDGVAEEDQWLAFCYKYEDMGNGEFSRPFVSEFGSYVAEAGFYESVAYKFTAEESTTVTVVTEQANANIEIYLSEYSFWPDYTITGAGKYSFELAEGASFKVVVADIDYNAAEIPFTVTTALVYDMPTSGTGTDVDPFVIGAGIYQAKNAPSISDWTASPVYYTFVAKYAGKVTVKNAEGEANIFIDGENSSTYEYMDFIFGTGSYTFTVSAGDVIVLRILSNGAVDNVEFEVSFAVTYGTPTAGDGSDVTPFVVADGVYQAKNAPSAWGFGAAPIFYTYVSTIDGTVTVELFEGELNADISGYSSTYEYMDNVNSYNTSYTYDVSVGTEIYLQVFSAGDTADDIEFSISSKVSTGGDGGDDVVVGSDAANAAVIVLGESTVSVTYTDYGGWGFCGYYWYKFECTTTGTYKLSSSDMNAKFNVYDGMTGVNNYEYLSFSGHEDFQSDTEIYCTFTAVAGNTYYISVSSNASQDHTYSFNFANIA